MLPRDANILLLVLVAASAIACIVADYAGRRSLVYVFKPATMLWVLALAAQGTGAEAAAYRNLVMVGLLFSLAGDVFLMLPSDRFVAGLASFLVGHLFYVAAFALDGGSAGPLLAWSPFAVAGGIVYLWLRPGLGRMALPVAAYVVAITCMAGLATARWIEVGSTGPLLACAGATLFAFSDGVLAANRFRRPFVSAQAIVLGSYFTGQCLIALSTGVGEALFGPS